MRSKVRAKLRKNRIIALIIGIVVVVFCAIMLIQIFSLRAQNRDMEARKQRLAEQLREQEARQAELDDDESYVKTREYIEEKAKSIGYVYPDEIIFKRED